MFKNYFKTAWRNLLKNKGYSAINIGGLAVGMAIAILIGLWVYDELSFDKYHNNYDRIAQVMQRASFNGKLQTQTANPALMATAIRIKYGSDFKYVLQASWQGDHLVSYKNNNTLNNNSIFAEPGFLDMLSLRMIKGTRNALKDPYNIVISASAAKAIFGNEEPMGKTLKLDRNYPVKVTGVFEDLPANTSFHELKMIMPWDLWLVENPWVKQMDHPWRSNFSQTFVQIADNGDMQKVSDEIKPVKMDNIDAEERSSKWEVFLQPMSKWHLYNDFKDGYNVGGDIKYVWLFGIIGVFCFTACLYKFYELKYSKKRETCKRSRHS